MPFSTATGGAELAAFADAGGIPPTLDRRADNQALLRTLNRELIRMGGARARRRRP